MYFLAEVVWGNGQLKKDNVPLWKAARNIFPEIDKTSYFPAR